MNLLRTLVAVAITAISLSASAQEFPSKTVKIVVPYPPGGGVDIFARSIAEELKVVWNHPVIVENRSGASTIIGASVVINSVPDGHTLLFTTDASITSNPHLFAKLPFDPMKDLAPITELALFDLMIVTHPSLPVSNLRELLAYASSTADPIPYSSFGNASQAHVFFEAFAKKFGVKLNHIPYRGMADSLQAAVAGDVKLSLLGAGASWEFVRAGKLRSLAIARSARNPLLPDVPTMDEVGLSDLDPKPWFGLFAPKGTPLELRTKIWSDISKVLANGAISQRLVADRGYVLKMSAPEAFEEDLKREWSFRRDQIRLSGVKVE